MCGLSQVSVLSTCFYVRHTLQGRIEVYAMKNRVGVMDSGVGGLTVLEELVRVASNCDYLYVADHAFCPYGTRTFEQIQERVLAVARYLAKRGVSSIVVACNTASIFAQEIAEETKLPVFDVITPTCERAVEASKNRRVALLATDATVKSQVYQKALLQRGIRVFAYSCSSFVSLVESCATDIEISQTIETKLSCLPQDCCDTVILGCTHFPFLTEYIAEYTDGAQIISCAQPVAQFFAQCVPNVGCGKRKFYTTGNPMTASLAARPFGNVTFTHVDV